MSRIIRTFCYVICPNNVSYNVHGLIHLVNDVKKFDPLGDFSAFKYENYLQTLKKLLRKYDKPLQQIVRRYTEYKKNEVAEKLIIEETENFVVDSRSVHTSGPLIHDCCTI